MPLRKREHAFLESTPIEFVLVCDSDVISEEGQCNRQVWDEASDIAYDPLPTVSQNNVEGLDKSVLLRLDKIMELVGFISLVSGIMP